MSSCRTVFGVALPAAVPLALFYAAVFTVVGVHLPFWPVWLKARGLSDTEIGLVVGVTAWARVVANPLFAHVVDRTGRRTTIMIILATVSLLLFTLFLVVDGFVQILVLSALWGGMFASVLPLGESLTMLTAYARRFDYGRIRLWGSLTFIGASVGCGFLLTDHPPSIVVWLLLGALGLSLAACLLLEDLPRLPPRDGDAAAVRRFLRNPLFWLFLVSASLINASHNLYYSFATLHWTRAGIPSDVIGWLWAEAVAAEIVLFAFSNAVVARLGPVRLLVLGGLGGALRWTVIGLSTSLPVLAAEQILHAATFGAVHLGAMHFIARAAPPGASARAQAIYGSVGMGLMLGLATLAAGPLYEALAGAAFLSSAGVALVGAGVAMILRRRWDGGSLAG